jgi:ankyrin repeat protein
MKMDEFKTEKMDSQKHALFQAAEFGDAQLVQYLLNKGLDIDSQDEEGDTPLHHAVRWGHNAVVTYLLRRRASVFIKNKKGYTAILEAYATNHGQLATEMTCIVIEKKSIKSVCQSFQSKKKDPKKEKLRTLINGCKEQIQKNYLNRSIVSRLMARHNERAKALTQALGRCTSDKDVKGLIKNQCDLLEKGKSNQAISPNLLVSRWSTKIKNKPNNVSNSSFYKVLRTLPGQKPLPLLVVQNQRQLSIMPRCASEVLLRTTRV